MQGDPQMNRTLIRRAQARGRAVGAVAAGALVALGATTGLASAGSTEPTPGSEPESAAIGDEEWNQLIADAKEEGSLLAYSAVPPDTNALIQAAFNEVYPDIDVEILRITTNELVPRFEAEMEGGAEGPDVLMGVEPTYNTDWAARGLLVPLVGPTIAAHPEVILDDGMTINPGGNVFGLAWNPAAVDGPITLEDLTDPRFKGRIGGYDWVATSTLGINAYYGELMGEEWFEAIAANEPIFYTSVVQMAQDMAAGVIDATYVMVEPGIADLPLEIAYFDNPPGYTYLASASAAAEHPNAAQLFVDFAMTIEGQEAWAHQGVSALPGVEGAILDTSEVELLTAEWYEPELLDEWRTFLQDTFDRQ